MDTDLARLVAQARRIRADVVRICHVDVPERKGHPGPALSAADLVAALYFGTLRVDPGRPRMPERDRFILSKGHASPVLYAALANRGFFGRDRYPEFRRIDGMLQGHPDMKGTPGVDMTTGSLGHGLAAGIGMALSARIDKLDFRVWVLLGDGECQEGLVWEAAMAAGVYRLANLTAIVDANGWQSCDSVVCTMPLEPFAEKWRAFGWNVVEIDGHDMAAIVRAYREAAAFGDGPTVILARTVKGKGVSFMENDNSWHQRALTEAEYAQALAELEGGAFDGR